MEPVPARSHELKSPVQRQVDGTYTSSNWGGCAIQGPPSSWNGVPGFWVIPTVSQPPEPQGKEGGWDSSSWTGLDGDFLSPSNVVQAGVEQKVNAAGQASYVAWFEWFVPPPTNLPPGTQVDSQGYPVAWGVGKPNGKYSYIDQANIPNFPVTAGQTVMCSVTYTADNSAADVAFATVSKITCRKRWVAVRGIALRLTITTSAQDGSATSARTTAAPTCPVPPMIKTRNAILGLVCKLTEKASVIGAHPLLNEPALIVKTEDILQVPDDALAFRRQVPSR